MSALGAKEVKAQLHNAIRSFLNRPSSYPWLILDTRPRQVYRTRHLAPSTNIPLDRLERSLFQLPFKHMPFAVLESEGVPKTAGLFGGEARPSEVLKSKGWRVDWVFNDHPHFWTTVDKELSSQTIETQITIDSAAKGGQEAPAPTTLKIVDSSDSITQNQTKYHFLFQPTPVLVRILPTIERELMALRASCFIPAHGVSQLLRCLDVGCGSGRDMTYMVARSANGLSEAGAEWSVLGMDQRADICQRARQLADDTFLDDDNKEVPKGQPSGRDLAERVQTIVGKIDPQTGIFWVPSSTSQLKYPLPAPLPLPLDNIRYRDPSTDERHRRILRERSGSNLDNRYDLIIMVRFLQRSLFVPMIEHWLRPGGFVLLSTFVSDVDLPSYSKPGPAHRLNTRAEAREIFEGLGLQVIMDEVSVIEDAKRSVATVVARKPILEPQKN
ncbi:hypothetical protein EDD11_010138 [Mortierella claussenii]|nr:hypothetical protein EDD11_010138 [Mortierella claussenii]